MAANTQRYIINSSLERAATTPISERLLKRVEDSYRFAEVSHTSTPTSASLAAASFSCASLARRPSTFFTLRLRRCKANLRSCANRQQFGNSINHTGRTGRTCSVSVWLARMSLRSSAAASLPGRRQNGRLGPLPSPPSPSSSLPPPLRLPAPPFPFDDAAAALDVADGPGDRPLALVLPGLAPALGSCCRLTC